MIKNNSSQKIIEIKSKINEIKSQWTYLTAG